MNKIIEFRGRYRFLSNFWHVPVQYDGVCYSTVEHAYQAAKTFNEVDRIKIFHALTPGDAKRLGKFVTLRSDWELVKLDIMYDLVKQKFSEDGLRILLLDTEDAELIEGNWWHDTFWGVDLRTGKGENHLGKILMRVREELKNS